MDTFSRERRSEIMGRIRSTNTRAELTVRSLLHRAGFRFRLYNKELPGKPDIVLSKRRIVIFVHGCFWHGHQNRREGRQPKSIPEYWNRKLDRNLSRDTANPELLESLGWKRIVVWEGELKNREALEQRLISELMYEKR